MSDINNTLKERGSRYGDFANTAAIIQKLKEVITGNVCTISTNWNSLSPSQKEALEMIVHKIGRILNGDPNYDDSWRDIAGYATLIVNQLNSENGNDQPK